MRRTPPLSRRLIVPLGCALLALAGVLVPSSGATSPSLRVIATGLANPRKLFVGSDGAVYVVDSGSGGVTPTHRCPVTCVGRTGAITRIAPGPARTVVSGLGSFSVPTGQEAEGPSAVVVQGGTYYVLMQDMNLNAQGVNMVGLPDAGDLFETPAGTATPKLLANFGAFEAAHNPDHGAGPGARYGQPPIDSDPYALVSYRGGFAVADAAGNDLLWVSPKGVISVLAVFPIQTEKLTKNEQRGLGPHAPASLPVQSVPSALTVGADGSLYVGELTGWPFQPGKARIWKVRPGEKPTIYASGFTNISDLAFDGPNLLVLEIAENGLLDPTSTGALIRLAPNGTRTTIATSGLAEPTGLAVANGLIYIANNGVDPGSGRGPHGEVVTLPASLGS